MFPIFTTIQIDPYPWGQADGDVTVKIMKQTLKPGKLESYISMIFRLLLTLAKADS